MTVLKKKKSGIKIVVFEKIVSSQSNSLRKMIFIFNFEKQSQQSKL